MGVNRPGFQADKKEAAQDKRPGNTSLVVRQGGCVGLLTLRTSEPSLPSLPAVSAKGTSVRTGTDLRRLSLGTARKGNKERYGKDFVAQVLPVHPH